MRSPRPTRWPRALLALLVLHLTACAPGYGGTPPGIEDLPPEAARVMVVERLQSFRPGDGIFVELHDGEVIRGDYRAHDESALTVSPITDVDHGERVIALADVRYVEEVEIGFGRRATHVVVLGGLIAGGIVASIIAGWSQD